MKKHVQDVFVLYVLFTFGLNNQTQRKSLRNKFERKRAKQSQQQTHLAKYANKNTTADQKRKHVKINVPIFLHAQDDFSPLGLSYILYTYMYDIHSKCRVGNIWRQTS